jgi:hypothetical protein
MPKGNTLSRLAIASLAAAALGAPAAAAAQPIMDMHASTVNAAAAEQDLRGEAASESAVKPAKVDRRGEAAAESAVKPAKVDLRGEAAADPSRAPVSRPPLPGPPTWPAHPTPLMAPTTAVVADDGDGGIDIPASVFIVAGTLLAAGGMGAAALRFRTRVAH